LTQRAHVEFVPKHLPLDDRSVDALTDVERDGLARHWSRRAQSERRIGSAFANLLPRMRAAGAAPIVLERLALASGDEHRHSEICRLLASHYAGRALPELEPEAAPLQHFGSGDERVELALLVAGTCCINEALATVFLRESLRAARTPLAREANRLHLREEINHARLGYAHLASSQLDVERRALLGEHLPYLLAANVPLWLAPDPFIPEAGIADHGQPARSVLNGAIVRAVRELVLPGFVHVGVPVDATLAEREWQ
jgi:hypothetical protein